MVHVGEVNRPESGSAKRSAGNEIGGLGPRIDSHEVLHVGKVNRSEYRSAKKSAGSEIGASGSMMEVVIEEPMLNELHEVDKNVVGLVRSLVNNSSVDSIMHEVHGVTFLNS
ncbi:hypothetical protein ACOSP7_012064 [Xanthoceras sorbifolium]